MPATLRSLLGAVAAVPIALGLFYLMQSLIDTQFEQEDVKTRKIADIVVPDKVIETNLKEVLPEKVEDPDEPPPDMEPLDFDTDLDMSTANMAPTVAVNVSINASGLSSGDGEYLPIVKSLPSTPDELRQEVSRGTALSLTRSPRRAQSATRMWKMRRIARPKVFLNAHH